MIEIRLERQNWYYDPTKPLGAPGGFGAVFEGQSPDGTAVAIKKLHLGSEESAHREFRVASQLVSHPKPHLIPTFDSGEDANTGSYFIVMARASKSLESDLDQSKKYSLVETVDILMQVTEGIRELDGLIHRDLKPANVLFHDGTWKLADFGIARFVEESTSLNTLKGCLSPQYAAPEQWLLESAKAATDVYALGCIGYKLLSGRLPFEGPKMDDYRDQHLHRSPSSLPEDIPPTLRTLIAMLLRKSPEARPQIQRIRDILGNVELLVPRHASPIAEAAVRLEHVRSREESAAAEQKSIVIARERLALSGHNLLDEMFTRLRQTILSEAPSCREEETYLKFGTARFSLPKATAFNYLQVIPPLSFEHSQIDVVLAKTIQVEQFHPEYFWSSSLLYCRLPKENDYRWYEVSFMSLGSGGEIPPFSLIDVRAPGHPRFSHLDLALSATMHVYQAAFGPVSVDDENEGDFIERWMSIFAAAAEGKLKYPSSLPFSPTYWRQIFS
ncbi:serine/threonine-protein kinase [Granulicella aggregans]|uniref:serine/threonine-protein kinase n=1 Tax=Granulicella aggregans TaxID=474949 RepID=UPI0021DF9ACF|nr:serine/threonine-protein kinase [Granulicella aggregans]